MVIVLQCSMHSPVINLFKPGIGAMGEQIYEARILEFVLHSAEINRYD